MHPRFTDGIDPTRFNMACIPTGADVTLVWIRAIIVGLTGGDWCNFSLARTIWANKCIRWTRTDDCPDGQAVLHATGLVRMAWVEQARVLTLGVNAGQPWGTVSVHLALGKVWLGWFNTSHIARASESDVTAALRLMVAPRTGGLRCTATRVAHRYTLLAQYLTLVVIPTVVVHIAFHAHAGHEGVALQPGRAHTARLVVLDAAFCAPTAWLGGCGAGVDTVLLHAGLVQWAVVVNATFRSITLSVRITAIALRTSAHWVMCTGCTCSFARTRILHNAGIDATLVDTRLGLGALGVFATFRSCFNWITVGKWIASSAPGTCTGCTVLADCTLGCLRARVGHYARIDAATVPTDFLGTTIVVATTTGVGRRR